MKELNIQHREQHVFNFFRPSRSCNTYQNAAHLDNENNGIFHIWLEACIEKRFIWGVEDIQANVYIRISLLDLLCWWNSCIRLHQRPSDVTNKFPKMWTLGIHKEQQYRSALMSNQSSKEVWPDHTYQISSERAVCVLNHNCITWSAGNLLLLRGSESRGHLIRTFRISQLVPAELNLRKATHELYPAD
jgi:hypothetical protein